MTIDVSKLVTAYYSKIPDPDIPQQRVIFGTSGHRGSSLEITFNEWHILAITQAICLYRTHHNITGPLFLGIDTHALSIPAQTSALEVLAANDVQVMQAKENEYTPTPVISHAILKYNHHRETGLADGIVITPSHNPPQDGGFKYNPPHGGPADKNVTTWIENKANEFLENKLKQVYRISKALNTYYDYLNSYINDLENVINMNAIRTANIRMGVDPLGGAGVHYWKRIAEHYGLNLTVTNTLIDPTFSFMPVDWDGQIRMDPSSPDAMEKLIELKDRFDIAFACDTDYDRHGIVTKSEGLMPSNHYLSTAVFYLFQHRPLWSKSAAVGKSLVSSQMIDRVTKKLGRTLEETPVGFKWFVDGLFSCTLGFAGEESAGASFLRLDGQVWTTDKDGFIAALLSAEMIAKTGKDPAEIYTELEKELGKSYYERIDASATPEEKKLLNNLSAQQVHSTDLAGEPIEKISTLDGLKVMAKNGWFAARPSGTEEVYKIYAESFLGIDHLKRIQTEAQIIINDALGETSSTLMPN